VAEIATVAAVAILILVATAIQIDMARLVTFLAIHYRLQAPARAFVESRLSRDGLRPVEAEVSEFLDECERLPVPSGSREVAGVASAIVFEDVWFRYRDDAPWALSGVSFTIVAGKVTGIVGASGAGKSTIMLLLYRFVDPTRGRILVDGTPLNELRIDAWRRQLGLMAQEVHLRDATMAENIGYGDPDAGPERVCAAADLAGLGKLIASRPEGLEARVGTGGYRLSGGQRQRIALARVVLRNPAVLLLDEATNALDAESELHVRLALQMFGANRTVVVVAHNLTALRKADAIVLLDHGKVLETGSPTDLLQRGGRFAHLLALQTKPLAEPTT
jgi:subfamily B ATP-binding cassette protein MsbA